MARAVSVRLDDEAMRALARLEATGKSRSEAIRSALVEAASRLSDKESLAAEVAALEADATDRAEMLAAAELMEACVQRGDVFSLRLPKGIGHEQHGKRYGVIVQSDALLPRSVVLIAPTSTIARSASFRPEIDIEGPETRVLVEQMGAVDVNRLGDPASRLTSEEQWGVDAAILTVLGLN